MPNPYANYGWDQKIILGGASLLVAGYAAYYGYQWFKDWRSKSTDTSKPADNQSTAQSDVRASESPQQAGPSNSRQTETAPASPVTSVPSPQNGTNSCEGGASSKQPAKPQKKKQKSTYCGFQPGFLTKKDGSLKKL